MWKKMAEYNIEILYILTSRFYPGFLLNFLFYPGFLTFLDKFQAISGPGQIKFKFPAFPGFHVPLGTLLLSYSSRYYIIYLAFLCFVLHLTCSSP